MTIKQVRVQVKSLDGRCDTVCTECSSVRAVVPREVTLSNSGVITGHIVANALGVSIWTEGCNCFVNFEYDDVQLIAGATLYPCDLCLVCGCIVEFVERTQGSVVGGFSVQANNISAFVASGETLRIIQSGLLTAVVTPGTPDQVTLGVSCADIKSCVGSDLLANNNNNTFTHQGVDGQVVTIDFGYSLNNPTAGIIQLTKPNGTSNVLDICAIIAASCPAPASPAITPISNNAIILAATGTLNHTLQASLQLSIAAGNAAVINGGGTPGLFVPVVPTSTLVDNANNSFTHVSNSGVSTTVQLGHNLISGPGTNLRLQKPDGTIQSIDLCPIISACAQTPITPVDTNSIDLTVSGTNNHTLQADVKLSVTAGNQASINATGLFVPTPAINTCADVRTCISALDTSSIDMSVNPANGQISAVAIISPTAGNVLQINLDGLYVPAASTGSCATIRTCFSGVNTTSINTTFNAGTGAYSSTVIVDPAVGNALTSGAAGLLVGCEAIQDCIGGGMTAPFGLVYNDPANRFEVAVSTLPGNSLVLNATGLYTAAGTTATLINNGDRTFTFNNTVNPTTTFCQGFSSFDLADACNGVGVNNMLREASVSGCVLKLRSAPEHTAVGLNSYTEYFSFPNGGNFNVAPGVIVRQLWANIPLMSAKVLTNPSACRAMLVHVTFDYGVGFLNFADGATGNSSGPQFEFQLNTNQGNKYAGRVAATNDPAPHAAPNVPALQSGYELQGSYSQNFTIAPSTSLIMGSEVTVYLAAEAPAGYQGSLYEVRQGITAFGVTV